MLAGLPRATTGRSVHESSRLLHVFKNKDVSLEGEQLPARVCLRARGTGRNGESESPKQQGP